MDPMGWLQVSELHHRIIIIQKRRFTVPPIFVKLWKCRLLGESLYLWKLKQKFRKLDSLELIFWGAKASLPKTKTASFAPENRPNFFCHDETFNHSNHSHTIHVWYIYLHLVVFNGKIYHTWMVRDWFSEPSCNCFVLSINYGHQLIWRLVVGDHTGWDKINFVHLNCRIQPLSKPFIWSLSGRFKDIFIYSIG